MMQNELLHQNEIFRFSRGVKPVEKKDGEGAHNWGNAAEIPDVEQAAE